MSLNDDDDVPAAGEVKEGVSSPPNRAQRGVTDPPDDGQMPEHETEHEEDGDRYDRVRLSGEEGRGGRVSSLVGRRDERAGGGGGR